MATNSPTPTPADLLARILRFVDDEAETRRALFPDWWDAECMADPGLTPEIEISAARLFGCSLETIRDPAADLRAARGSAFVPWTADALYRMTNNLDDDTDECMAVLS